MKGRYQGGMEKCNVSMMLLWVFFSLCTIIEFKVEARALSSLDREIEARLKLLNKPAVKSIKSEDGDIIDCVSIYKQPALDHSALKNHTIKMMPDFTFESPNSITVDAFNASSEVFQIWQKSGSCPDETIPIRRIRKEDLLRAESLDRFGQKPMELFVNSTFTTKLNSSDSSDPNDEVNLKNRSDAYLMTYAHHFNGAQANINVWNPRVDKPEDFTTAQMWLKAGYGRDNFESVESGWIVNPKLYGDHSTRLFVYWTKDTYRTTGCFDLTCSGFVQTNKNIMLGGAIGPISYYGQPQYELNYGIFMDHDSKWWLKIRRNIPIGYWPPELFSNLKFSSTMVEWGGQVFSYEVKGKRPHTETQMGSGGAANGRFGNACYMSGVRIRDDSLKLKYPQYITTHAAEPYCYNTLNDAPYGQDPVLYFGGAGRKPPYCS
ncbi:unnamed protein product [Lathyrus oleraceus]|nr:uncharacterized protein LOC127087950 [Pisum sativum]